jgi:hypothetical protein
MEGALDHYDTQRDIREWQNENAEQQGLPEGSPESGFQLHSGMGDRGYASPQATKHTPLDHPLVYDILRASIGGDASGMHSRNLAPGVAPAGNTPNTFTPPPPVTPDATPAAPMPPAPPAGGGDSAFDAAFKGTLDQEKQKQDEISRRIQGRDTTHYKDYDVD